MAVSQDSQRFPLRWVAAAIGIAVVVVVVGVVTLRAQDGGSDGVHLEHVHGLAIDPADGALYAGTHYGLYRATDDGIDGPIAERIQDFMGFTIVGPGHYLGSGHPGRGQEGPPHVGLIESTDGGESWVTRSLAGEADFHALDFAHEMVYGFNAVRGEFVVSEDMETWEVRSTTPMADFAVSPEDPDTIIATTEAGPAYSSDGGRSFTPIDDAPLMVLVDWAEDGTVVGVGLAGEVYAGERPDDLERVGELGDRPEALLVVDEDETYAAAGGRLLVSTDGGATWLEYPGT